jgi:hypothetical protein
MMCDHCGELPGTEPFGGGLAYCEPCMTEMGVEFAEDFGYVTADEAAAERTRVAKMRDALAEDAA